MRVAFESLVAIWAGKIQSWIQVNHNTYIWRLAIGSQVHILDFFFIYSKQLRTNRFPVSIFLINVFNSSSSYLSIRKLIKNSNFKGRGWTMWLTYYRKPCTKVSWKSVQTQSDGTAVACRGYFQLIACIGGTHTKFQPDPSITRCSVFVWIEQIKWCTFPSGQRTSSLICSCGRKIDS